MSPNSRRGPVAAAIGTCSAALLAAAVLPAHAASPSVTHQARPAHDHVMGASIKAHESHSTARAHTDALSTTVMRASQTPGLDVSHYQGSIDWNAVAAKGAKFVYIKATEGTGYRDPQFGANYNGSYQAGLIRGAYHYGRPDSSGGAKQADYFIANGGGWSDDGKTLPGTLDIEYGTDGEGGTCYGKSEADMAGWIKAFSDEYNAKTGRYPMIYTSANWWSQCVGTSGDFSATNPLWVARYSSSVGELPYGWDVHTIWQFDNSGTFPGDQDKFNGDYSRVQALAKG